jgi:hypothetical protein
MKSSDYTKIEVLISRINEKSVNSIGIEILSRIPKRPKAIDGDSAYQFNFLVSLLYNIFCEESKPYIEYFINKSNVVDTSQKKSLKKFLVEIHDLRTFFQHYIDSKSSISISNRTSELLKIKQSEYENCSVKHFVEPLSYINTSTLSFLDSIEKTIGLIANLKGLDANLFLTYKTDLNEIGNAHLDGNRIFNIVTDIFSNYTITEGVKSNYLRTNMQSLKSKLKKSAGSDLATQNKILALIVEEDISSKYYALTFPLNTKELIKLFSLKGKEIGVLNSELRSYYKTNGGTKEDLLLRAKFILEKNKFVQHGSYDKPPTI